MIKTEIILLILFVGMGLAEIPETCIDEQEFNRQHSWHIGKSLEVWLQTRKLPKKEKLKQEAQPRKKEVEVMIEEFSKEYIEEEGEGNIKIEEEEEQEEEEGDGEEQGEGEEKEWNIKVEEEKEWNIKVEEEEEREGEEMVEGEEEGEGEEEEWDINVEEEKDKTNNRRKRAELRNIKTDDTWRSKWEKKRGNVSQKFVVVKRADINAQSDRYKSLINEIRFYEKMNHDDEIKPYTPEYYGCVHFKGKIYMIIQYFKFGLQKSQRMTANDAHLNGFKKYKKMSGNQQIEFLTTIATVIDKIHSKGIALTNISPKNILLDETNGVLKPVFISFGQHQNFSEEPNSATPEQEEKELGRYESNISNYLLTNDNKNFVLSKENLLKADVLGFANLLYRTGIESRLKRDENRPYQMLLNYFVNERTISKREFTKCINFGNDGSTKDNNKKLFRELMADMSKPWADRTIRFPQIIEKLQRIRCLDENGEDKMIATTQKTKKPQSMEEVSRGMKERVKINTQHIKTKGIKKENKKESEEEEYIPGRIKNSTKILSIKRQKTKVRIEEDMKNKISKEKMNRLNDKGIKIEEQLKVPMVEKGVLPRPEIKEEGPLFEIV
jgi:hypothetical protein